MKVHAKFKRKLKEFEGKSKENQGTFQRPRAAALAPRGVASRPRARWPGAGSPRGPPDDIKTTTHNIHIYIRDISIRDIYKI